MYLSRYFTHDEPVATVDPDEEAGRWIDLLDERFSRLRPGRRDGGRTRSRRRTRRRS